MRLNHTTPKWFSAEVDREKTRVEFYEARRRREKVANLSVIQILVSSKRVNTQIMLGEHSVLDPPDPMPNSEVKRNSVDDSMAVAM